MNMYINLIYSDPSLVHIEYVHDQYVEMEHCARQNSFF